MQHYIGTKQIKAQPMTRAAYNEYRGWELPADEEGSDEGYLVEYLDGGQANHPNHEGYISWSPKAVFERAYIPMGRVGELTPQEQCAAGELAQLKYRIRKLELFIASPVYQTLKEDERGLLQSQYNAMNAYALALGKRVARFDLLLKED